MPRTDHGHWMGPGVEPAEDQDMVARCTFGLCPYCLQDVLHALARDSGLRWDKTSGAVVYREEAGTIIAPADLRVGHVVRDPRGVLYCTIADVFDQPSLLQLQDGDGHCLDAEDIAGPLTLVQSIA